MTFCLAPPKAMRPWLIALILTLWGLPWPAWALQPADPETLYRTAEECRRSLYASDEQRKQRHRWMACLERYGKIVSGYPGSDCAARALFRSADLQRRLHRYSGDTRDLDAALGTYRRIAEEYRDHRLADDAQYFMAEIYYRDKGDPAQAYVEFLKVDVKFPSGDMRPKAKKMLEELADVLQKKNVQTLRADAAVEAAGPVAVQGIRYWSTPNYTRIVIDAERPIQYTHRLLNEDPGLKTPRRLFLDLAEARVASELKSEVPIQDGLLKGARAGQYAKDTVRVVLDIESLGSYKVFHLYDPFRIVVDVRRQEEAPTKTAGKSPAPPKAPGKGIRIAREPDAAVSLARQLGLSVKRIVVDPGHGGKDPGCYDSVGHKEKELVLELAKTLAQKLKARIGCEVLLTREGDRFIQLEQRTAIANMKKADLFISLHINAHRDKGIHGIETYYLNMATDERAVMVAARENATSEKNLSDLQTILKDLMLNTKIQESSRLAHEVQKGMVAHVTKSHGSAKDLGVKQAPFYVLIGAEMPAILVETGFLTHPMEKRRLSSKAYRDSVAEGICEGLRAYIKSIEEVYQGG
jgi:N-acetylmuramoyl-L-alanine amidase